MLMSEHSQSNLFLNGEGDAWFVRNRENANIVKVPQDIAFICSTLEGFENKINRVLEIGCAGGEKLSALQKHFNAEGYGIDPSKEAIESAKKHFGPPSEKLNFCRGLATDLPFEDGQFDLVFFGFCLYLVPPTEIFKAVAEANRVLRGGGFLAILDFDYGQFKVSSYKHAEGIFSYKNNYSRLFTSSGYFHQMSKWSYSHFGNSFTEDRDERVSIEVLFKELN
jgi:ubiquinone/menaquinone biosynthesis C-methylase UbiE